MPCAGFPWVYASLATWCTAPISRTILAVEALRLVKKDPTRERGRLARTKTTRERGRLARPHKDHGRLFAGIRVRAGRPRSRVDNQPG